MDVEGGVKIELWRVEDGDAIILSSSGKLPRLASVPPSSYHLTPLDLKIRIY